MKTVKVEEWSRNASNLTAIFRRRGVHLEDHFLVGKQTTFPVGHSCRFRQYVLLCTVLHVSNFISVTNLMHKILHSYNVTVLYMFRAVLCSSSRGQIVCI